MGLLVMVLEILVIIWYPQGEKGSESFFGYFREKGSESFFGYFLAKILRASQIIF